MRKGEIIEGIIEELKFPNKGCFTYETENGKWQIQVKNALPGQKVSCRVGKKRNGRVEASLIEVIEPAACEHTPRCPKFGDCGGCLYLSFPYEEEAGIKEQQVHGLLSDAVKSVPKEIAPLDAPWRNIDSWMMPIVKSPVYCEYRNKMEFTFGDEIKGGPMTLGMHKRGSFYDIADSDMCEIVDSDYRKIVKTVRNYMSERMIPFYHRMRQEGYLRHLLVRKASHTGEILIDLVTTTQISLLPLQGGSDNAVEAEKQLLKGLCEAILADTYKGEVAGILHTHNDSAADVVEDQGTDVLYGRAYFEEELLGLRFIVTPFSFFQTNSYGAEVLYDIARQYISELIVNKTENSKKPVIFDLYCGTGTISQLMAPVASKVVGVEIVEEAVEAAGENAKRNGIDNCRFIAGDVLKVIDEIEEKPDLIILDPPRDGVHPKALPKIASYGVQYILYISCKPTSLARDIPSFAAFGYYPVKGTIVDQFPRTGNMETVCLLSNTQKNKESCVTPDVEMDDYYRIKGEGKSTK